MMAQREMVMRLRSVWCGKRRMSVCTFRSASIRDPSLQRVSERQTESLSTQVTKEQDGGEGGKRKEDGGRRCQLVVTR